MKYILSTLLFFLSISLSAQGYLKMKEKAEEAFNNYEYEDAVTWASDALLLAEVEVGDKSLEYANVLNDLGIYKFYNYQYEEGIQNVEDACLIKKDLLGEDNIDYLISYSDLGSLYYMNEENQKAEAIFQVTVPKQRILSGSNSVELAYELNKLGLALTNLGEFGDAEKNFKESRRIFENNNMAKSADFGSLLNNMASLYQSMGNYLNAEEYYLEANKNFAKTEGKESYNYSIGIQNLGDLYGEMGRYDDAAELFEIGIEINIKLFGENSMEYAKSLNNQAYIANHLGNYIESEKKYLQSLEIKKSLAGSNTPTYNRTLNNLAVLYMDYGNKHAALKILESLLEQVRKEKNSVPFSFITYAQNLVVLYIQINEVDKARSIQLEIMELQKSITGEMNHEYAMMLNNLSELHRQDNDLNETGEYLLKSRDILEELGHESTIDYIIILYQIGILYLDKKEYENAVKILEDAHELAMRNINDKNQLSIKILINLGEAHKKLHEYNEAMPLYTKALDTYSEIINQDFAFMSTAERSNYLKEIKLHLALYNSFALEASKNNEKIIEDIYLYNNQFKSMGLRSALKQRKLIVSSNNSVLISQYNDWQKNREYLNKLYQLPVQELISAKINIDSIEHASNDLEKSVYAYLGKHQSMQWSGKSIKDVRQELSEDEAAVEMIRIPHYGSEKETFDIDYLAIVIYPKGDKAFDIVLFDKGRKLDNELSNLYFDNLFKKVDDVNSYHIFWKPIGDKISDYKTIYLSRAGIFNIINVNTLKSFENQEYVIDTWDIHYVTSTADIVNLKANRNKIDLAGEGNIHLFGYPDYYYNEATKFESEDINKTEVLASRRQIDAELQFISELPGTKVEVESIKEVLSQQGLTSTVYIEKDATESIIKSLEKPKVLHLATHGYFDFDSPESSSSSSSLNRSVTTSQPLLRSGIMMAGSAYVLKLVKENIPFISEFEDGVLNGFEASNLQLDNTDLVVLSACLTSVGQAKVSDNESYYGMLSAFLSAGSKSVIASCWSVDDEATKDLMISFYSNWEQEETYFEAFKKAQLATKEKYDQPYYWGAFIMVE